MVGWNQEQLRQPEKSPSRSQSLDPSWATPAAPVFFYVSIQSYTAAEKRPESNSIFKPVRRASSLRQEPAHNGLRGDGAIGDMTDDPEGGVIRPRARRCGER